MDENWKLSVGKKEISGKDRKSLFSAMDELVAGGDGSPLVVETESDLVLDRAAEYAAQKGYDLVAPTPEQNLRITGKQNALAGEEIVGGDFEPSLERHRVKVVEADDHSDEKQKQKTAPAPDDPQKIDVAKVFGDILDKTSEPKKKDEPTRQQFPKIVPPKTLAERWKIPTVKDHGDKITVTRMGMMNLTPKLAKERDALVAAALLKARERFGEPVRVTPAGGLNKLAGRAFEEAAIRAAIAQGVKLEMATERGRKLYEQALEKERHLAKSRGSFEPSRQKEKERALPAPARDKGKSRGLSIA